VESQATPLAPAPARPTPGGRAPSTFPPLTASPRPPRNPPFPAPGPQESKLKNLALRSNLAVRRGETKEVMYR
jgi:hypothetical protein